jgi:hypothetical protein
VGVDGGGVEALVTEEGLDGLESGAGLDEVGGEGVSERARGDVLQDAGLLAGGAEGALDAGGGDRLSGVPSENRNITVDVLDVSADIAVARASSSEYLEYHSLANCNGEWRIINILWRSQASAARPR